MVPSHARQKMAVTGLMLKAKALEFYDQIKENDRGFNASYGFKNFNKGEQKAFLKFRVKSFLPQLTDAFKEKLYWKQCQIKHMYHNQRKVLQAQR